MASASRGINLRKTEQRDGDYCAPLQHAEAVNEFYERHFNPYLNFHRPCGVPEMETNAKGKQKRRYHWYATPWEILRQLPDLARHLKAGLTVEHLNERAKAQSDMEAARRMQEEKKLLFEEIQWRQSA